MIPLEEARAIVLAGCPRSAPARVGLREALGCVLAAPVVARQSVPPFATSAMDGYALRAADSAGAPVQLKVVGTVTAGSVPLAPVGSEQAMRIMTGAPLPDGADAVCMVELTRTDDAASLVTIEVEVPAGNFVRRAGEDVAAGEQVFGSGEVLSAGHLGVLASVGATGIDVYRRPRVGVLSTGDELVEAGEDLGPGKIRDANRETLLGVLAGDGYDAVDLGIVRDDEAVIEAAIAAGAGSCDALVTSGGVSVGDLDFVKVVLDRLSGGSMRSMQVAIRPAKPLAFGTLASSGTPVFGLPGNPVSAMVSFELFVRPALRQMGGHSELYRPEVSAVADEDLSRKPDGKVHFVRSVASFRDDGLVHVWSSGGQESHMLRAMALANALAILPDGAGVAAGERVRAMLLEAIA